MSAAAAARTAWPYTRLVRWPEGRPRRAGADVSAPDKVAKFFASMGTELLTQESIWVMLLDIKNKLLDFVELTRGTVDASLLHPRDVFGAALVAGAVSVIVLHNHPSGDPEPSPEDLALSRRMSMAGSVLGINLIDSMVIGANGKYVSLSEKGLL